MKIASIPRNARLAFSCAVMADFMVFPFLLSSCSKDLSLL